MRMPPRVTLGRVRVRVSVRVRVRVRVRVEIAPRRGGDVSAKGPRSLVIIIRITINLVNWLSMLVVNNPVMPVTEKRSNHQLQLVKKGLQLTPVNVVTS